jgi:PAS domain S-box-containing protein
MTEKSKITSRLKRLFNSLSFRQARTAVFIALVLGIGFSVLQIANDLQNVRSEMDKTFHQSLKSVEESAFQAAFGLDKALANTVVRGLFQQPAIIEVKIMDNFGDVMAIQKRPLQQSISKWLTKELFGETEIYNIRLKSKASGFYAGDLSIEVDVYAIAEDFLERSGLILLSGLLRNLFLAIILALLFHKMLSKPLTNVAELISSGNAKIKPPRNHEDDELGEIVKAHNELSKRHAEVTSSLQEKENRFRALFENANDSIFISDAESHRFLEVNKTAADRLGYDKHELLGLRFEDIDGSGHLNHAELYAEKTMESGQLVFEHSHRRKDGSVVPVEISTRIIEAGGKMVFQSFVRDITDRKRSEEQLKRIAHYDLLTDLPSRVLLLDRLNQAMVQCQRRNQSLAVAYLDLWIQSCQ